MKISQIAAQLYTCREICKTLPDFTNTIKRLKKVGYDAVQVSGIGPIPESEIVAVLQGEGVTCCATHEPSQKILDDPQAVVARLQALQCKMTAYPHPNVDFLKSQENLLELCRKLDAAGKVLADAGLTLGYHNHSLEFIRIEGKLVLQTIFDNTDPRHLVGELDTYWVQHGGCDPVAWCAQLKGRLPFIHLKDYTPRLGDHPIMCEVGSGNLNFPGIIAAAEASGCEWFIVEQDTCPGDPVDSLAKSFDYLKTLAS